MFVEVVDPVEEMGRDLGGRLEVCVLKRGFLQYQKPGLNEIQPCGLRWCPREFDIAWFGLPQIESLLGGAEVVPNEVDFPLPAVARQHTVLEKGEDRFAGLAWVGQSYTFAGMRS